MENLTIIDSYTKQDAIQDGSQIDISSEPETKEAGFNCPVYLTSSVYELVKVPAGLVGMQDYKGRLWDLVYMAAQAFRAQKSELVKFSVYFTTNRTRRNKYGDQEHCQHKANLWLMFNSAEGFTILRPEEY